MRAFETERSMQTTTVENALASDYKLGAEPAPLTPAQIFAQVDMDNDGVISFEEFAEWWNNKQVETRSEVDEDTLNKIWDLFDAFDADGSRGLAQGEFSRLLEEVAKADWRKMTDPSSGRAYYAHPHTRQTRWVEPTVEDFLRDQGIVHTGIGAPVLGHDAESSDDVHMVLNMWKLYLKSAARARSAHYKDFFLYALYTCIVFLVVLGNMPSSTGFLVHQEALTDLLLDEEFGVVANHKKSWYDVMTPQEMWQWADGPLTEAFYGGPAALTDEPGPSPLLWTNRLIGGIQLRQIRVRPNKCPDTKWAMDAGRLSQAEQEAGRLSQAERACSATWRPKREARFTRSPDKTARPDQRSTAGYERLLPLMSADEIPVDDGRFWWTNVESEDQPESLEWATAGAWYDHWGYSWLVEPQTKLKASPALVRSFVGDTSANEYGQHGYAVVLPKQGRDFVEQIRQLKGEFVCAKNTAGPPPFVNGQYHTAATEQERESVGGEDGCRSEDDCPLSAEACRARCPECEWDQKPEFVDEFTRMFAVSFNLHNSNDFDEDDYDPAEKAWRNTDHMDDHIVMGQVTFAFHPSGHIEKYERISIVRPMRRLGFLDTDFQIAGAIVMVGMAALLFVSEVRTVQRIGLKSYFIESENNIWNAFEIIFFSMFVRLLYLTWVYYDESRNVELKLAKARADGTIDTTYIDIFDLKSEFRDMLRGISLLVFMSILKLFKVRRATHILPLLLLVPTRTAHCSHADYRVHG